MKTERELGPEGILKKTYRV